MPPDTYRGPDMLNSRENHFEALSCPDHNNDATTANTIGPDIHLSDDQNFVPNRALWIFYVMCTWAISRTGCSFVGSVWVCMLSPARGTDAPRFAASIFSHLKDAGFFLTCTCKTLKGSNGLLHVSQPSH
jgi:hypothetical protein